MESVGIPEEEVRLNTPVPVHHTTPSSSYPNFLSHVSNQADKSTPVSENYSIESMNYGETDTFQWDKIGKHPSSTVGGIR